MKRLLPILFLVVCGTLVADESSKAPLPPPQFTRVRATADGKSLEMERPEFKTVQYQVTKSVPETRVRIVGGVEVTEEVLVPVTETATKTVCVMVCQPLPLEGIELRTVKGERYKPEDIVAAIGKEITPVIVVNRYVEFVEGKPVTKLAKFDPSYLKLLADDAKILIMPAPKALPAAPVPVTPIPAAPIAIPAPAPPAPAPPPAVP